MRRFHDDRGAAMVELPFAIGIILLIAMGVLTITQVAWAHLDLSNTVRDAARYGTRTEYDPSATTITSARHRTADEIAQFAARAGSESGVTYEPCKVLDPDVDEAVCGDITVSPASLTGVGYGDHVTVTIAKTVNNPLYQTAASITNTAGSILHIGHVFREDGVQITASSSSYVE